MFRHRVRRCVSILRRDCICHGLMTFLNAREIFAATLPLSAFCGEKGPDAERGREWHAQMAAAEGGLFSEATDEQLPQTPTISVNHLAGMLLSNAILAGLVSRERTGTGVQVFTDLHSAALTAHVWDGPRTMSPDTDDAGDVNLTLTEKTLPHAWKTANGFIEISPVFTDNPVQLICKGLGLPDLTASEMFATPLLQYENRVALRSEISARLLTRATSEWLLALEAEGILCAEIRTPAEALNAPAAIANGMVVDVPHPIDGELRLVGCAVRTNATPRPSTPPPQPGQHTKQILDALNRSSDTKT